LLASHTGSEARAHVGIGPGGTIDGPYSQRYYYDQWGNITAGIDFCRKKLGKQVYGLTLPLITNADGTKFGKTETGAIWLDPQRTSVYKFYQFWIRVDDRDVIRYLKFFTFLSLERIGELAEATRTAPERRQAQRILAREVTALVHGQDGAREAETTSATLFGGWGTDGLSAGRRGLFPVEPVPVEPLSAEPTSLPGRLEPAPSPSFPAVRAALPPDSPSPFLPASRYRPPGNSSIAPRFFNLISILNRGLRSALPRCKAAPISFAEAASLVTCRKRNMLSGLRDDVRGIS